MTTEKTSKQNAIIWSITSFIILLLCGIIGWLVNGKDTALTSSINSLILAQNAATAKAEDSDNKVLGAFNKLCDRVGAVESRVGNLEIFIQMPFVEREKYLFNKKK